MGGKPGLILNGGILVLADPRAFTVTGSIQAAAQSYSYFDGTCSVGLTSNTRGVNISGQLSGSGRLVIFHSATNHADQISGFSNAFSGQWIVKAGWMHGSGYGSLGTNSITMDPRYPLQLDASIVDGQGPAVLELSCDINSAGTLTSSKPLK